jgi:guanine nucleotide-binding protein alpha-1 subunit
MDVKAIIFLAPMSVFDEKLQGDSGINSLEDSINLWSTVYKSKLLSKVNLHYASLQWVMGT